MPDHSLGLSGVLRNPGFELIPMKTTLKKARSLPPGTRVSVTASPTKGMAPTIELTEQLSAIGLNAVPHLAARQTKTLEELEGIVTRLTAAGTKEAFIVGGDADDPGDFDDAMDLIQALDELEHPFEQIGVAGYPEGHPNISNDRLMGALVEKQPYAAYIGTQLCFDVATIETWVREVRHQGIELPIVIGVPGVTDLATLIGISARIGVGTSLRFLSKNRSIASRLSRRYSPQDLVEALADLAEDRDLGIDRLQFHTFNQVDATYDWYVEATSTTE